jgi:hypothetical protein
MANGVDWPALHVKDPRQIMTSWVRYVRRISESEFQWSALRYESTGNRRISYVGISAID